MSETPNHGTPRGFIATLAGLTAFAASWTYLGIAFDDPWIYGVAGATALICLVATLAVALGSVTGMWGEAA